mgnify:CR=1 FL=1
MMMWQPGDRSVALQCINRPRTVAYQRTLFSGTDFECVSHNVTAHTPLMHVIPLQTLHSMIDPTSDPHHKRPCIIFLRLTSSLVQCAMVLSPSLALLSTTSSTSSSLLSSPSAARFHVDEREWVSLHLLVKCNTSFFSFPLPSLLVTTTTTAATSGVTKQADGDAYYGVSIACDVDFQQQCLRLALFVRDDQATARLNICPYAVELSAIPNRLDPSQAGYAVRYTTTTSGDKTSASSINKQKVIIHYPSSSPTRACQIDFPLRVFREWAALLASASRIDLAFHSEHEGPLFVHFSYLRQHPHHQQGGHLRREASFICSSY